MIAERIKIVNFRNIVEADLTFSDSFNLIFGKNAQGKTNLLEAIHMFSLGRSFRRARRIDMISFDAEYCFLSLAARSDNGVRFGLEMGFDRSGSLRLNQDGKRLSGMGDIVGLIPSVIFTPDDLGLAGGEPRRRRFYLDYTASQISPSFLRTLKNFKRALKQRNALLRAISRGESSEGLSEWNRSYADYAVGVVEGRVGVLELISPMVMRQYSALAGGGSEIELKYRCSFDRGSGSLREDIVREMEDLANLETKRGYSLVGPQYDDFRLEIDGVDVRRFGSQGQKRMVAVVLKLAQAETILKERGESPIVLLDDVASELDREKADRVRALLTDRYQSFITSPQREDLPRGFEGAFTFAVEEGDIRKV